VLYFCGTYSSPIISPNRIFPVFPFLKKGDISIWPKLQDISMKHFFYFFLLFLTSTTLVAQDVTFEATELQNKQYNSLDDQFNQYRIFDLDINAFDAHVKSSHTFHHFLLNLGDTYEWDMEIFPHDLRSPDYLIRVATDNGEQIQLPGENKTYQGRLVDFADSHIRLTLDQDFVYGYVRKGKKTFFIEPLNYFEKDADPHHLVVYEKADVIPTPGKTCGVTETQNQLDKYKQYAEEEGEKVMACFEVDLAIASDGLMFQSYGSVAAVENHNIGVMNNVAGNFDDEFNDEIAFVIVEQFVSTSPANDPWTQSTNANTVLGSFRNWGPNGFSQTHDLGQFWTDRDFNGGTIGIAYLTAVCTNNRYHCCQDFTSNANLLRVLTSHEIGHNFSLTHDGSSSPHIMAPAVQNTSTWSTQSQNEMNSYYPTRVGANCMAVCLPPLPPVPLFMANLNQLCAGSAVTFFDQSINNPTQWSWTFPGGNPSSSTERSPTVVYNNPGIYSVSLTVTNANGSNSTTISNYISVGPVGTDFFLFEDFESGLGGWTIDNPDGSDTWELVAVNGTRQGAVAMRMDNFNYNAPGTRDGLVSPPLDFTGRNNVRLEVEYAYARYNNNFKDSLSIRLSTDGGATYPFYLFSQTENGNGNFATAPQTTSEFDPSEIDDWCFGGGFGADCIDLDLSNFDNTSNIRIKIENVNGYGNNMFVDNIRLFSDCEVVLPPVAAFSADVTEGCAPMLVQFTDESENSPFSWLWSFPGGTPSVSTQQNPQVAYTQPGVYDVTLTAINLAGTDTHTETGYIVVGASPIADFDFSINGLDVEFTDVSQNTPTTWSWNLGDGTTSTEANPNHTYPGDGAYIVNLTVTNACGTSNITRVVTIITPPVAGFTADPTTGCADLTVQFTDQSSPSTSSWNWTFPGGDPATSTDQNPVVTYDTPGVYDVTLEVGNISGTDVITLTNYITVEDVPDAGFTSSVNGDIVDFTNTSADATTYSWDFGDGTSSTETSPSHMYTSDGTYTVTLTASNACGDDVFTEVVEISTMPIAGFTAVPQSGCVPLIVQFTDNSSLNVTGWSWSFPGGNPSASTDQNPVVEYANAGVYDVFLTVSNDNGTNSIAQTGFILVEDVPTAGFTEAVNGNIVDFTNTSTGATSYSWSFGDGNSSIQTNPSHTYDEDGVYTVVLTAVNDCGTVISTSVITILTPPTAGFSADITNGCPGMMVQFTDESSVNATNWNWTFEGGMPGTSTDQNPSVEYLQSGVFGVTLEVSNGAGSDIVVQTGYITVDPLPTAGFNTAVDEATVDFSNQSTDATSFTWNFGDGSGSSDANPSHTYAEDGIYTVILIAENDCGTDTIEQILTILTPPTAGFSADVTTGCPGLLVQFTDQSSSNATNWLWTFEGGTPGSSTDQNPSVEYLESGVFGVTLEASNGAGSDVFVETSYIVIESLPTAGFSETVNGTIVDFANSSTNATSYSWDFGDGDTSTEVNPSHDYGNDGTYTVTLTATNDCGTGTTTETIVIETPPVAGFSVSGTEGCVPYTVQFADESSSNTASWSWTFEGGDPATSTDQNPTVVYLNPGVFGVTLEVSNGAGSNIVTETDYITVGDVPTAGFASDVNDLTLTTTNTSVDADSYSWDFGDGNGSTDENPTHTYDEDGTYTVVLTATNECGSTEFTEVIVVETPPTAGFSTSTTEGCAPFTVQFTDESSSNTASWNWTFEGGDPAASTEQNPTVVYLNPGVFGVTLEVSNGAGSNIVTEESLITVGVAPSGSFAYSQNGFDVDFDADVTGTDSYSWDFGDGNGSTEENPSHTYDEDGVYNVILTIENECGSVEITETIEIITPPTAAFNVNPTSGCVPLTVLFENLSSANADNFLWEFEGGDPASSTDFEPVVIYNTPGTYGVTLTVSNPAGEDVVVQSSLIVVDGLPAADFSSIITGADVDFQNASVNANSYSWDFGDDTTSDEENPSHTYTEDGVYTVTLLATNDCGTVEITQTIAIATSGPVALFAASAMEGCLPAEITFENLSSENADSFEWFFEGGDPATTTDENPVVIYSTTGTFDVTLIAFNMNGSDTLTFDDMIAINDLPTAGFSAAADGATVDFSNSSIGGDSYAWNFGDGEESTEENPSHSYSQVGTYLVELVAFNSCGSDTILQEVEVVAVIPSAMFSADETTGCVPFTVQFTDDSQGGPTEWNWIFEGGIPATATEQNPVVVYNTPGTYDVTLEVSNIAGNNLLVQSNLITVGDVPQPEFTYTDDMGEVIFTNTTIGGSTYTWDFGDGGSSNQSSPTHTYTESGTYTVLLTASNECGDATFSQEITVMISSVGEIEGISRLDLFPNPNNGQFNLRIESNTATSAEVALRIYNAIGQQLIDRKAILANGVLQETFNLQAYPSGMYFLQLEMNGNTLTRKVIVE
jgi:PKD repeat protein